MNFRHFRNDESNDKYTYDIVLEDLDNEVYLSEKLLDEIKNVVGEDYVDYLSDNYMVITCQSEEMLDKVIAICIKYEEIFEEEYEENEIYSDIDYAC